MAIKKNKEYVLSFRVVNVTTGHGATGEASNITLKISKDGGAEATVSGTISEINATTMKGMYKVTLTAAEMNANQIVLKGESTTASSEVDPIYLETIINERPDKFIYIDAVNGVAGTDPDVNGLPNNPVNSFSDAIAIATELKTYFFYLMPYTSITLPTASYTNYVFCGADPVSTSIFLNSNTYTRTSFYNTTIYGNVAGGNFFASKCFLGISALSVQLPECVCTNCIAKGSITFVSGIGTQKYVFKDCGISGFDGIQFDMNDVDGQLLLEGVQGTISLANMTHANSKALVIGQGNLIVASSCDKPVYIYGNFNLENSGTGQIYDDGNYYSQNVRDALALDLTAGITPDSNSVDDYLTDLITSGGTPVNLATGGATHAGNAVDIYAKAGQAFTNPVTLADNATNKAIIDEGVWDERLVDNVSPAKALTELKMFVRNNFIQDTSLNKTYIKDYNGDNAYEVQMERNGNLDTKTVTEIVA